jgi:hypothetical protein
VEQVERGKGTRITTDEEILRITTDEEFLNTMIPSNPLNKIGGFFQIIM